MIRRNTNPKRRRGERLVRDPRRLAASPRTCWQFALASVIPRLRFGAVLLAVLWGFVVGGELAPASAQTVWELTPYRIRAFLATNRAPELTPQLEQDLLAELSSQVDSRIGAAWDVTFAEPPLALRRAMMAGLDAVAVDWVPADALELDKVLLLTVTADLAGYQITGRELDARTRTWGTVVCESALHPAKLRNVLFQVARTAFAPLARIEEVEKNTALLRLRAAGLPPRDPACLRTAAGDLFRPVVRYSDREGKFRRANAIPWTFLRVDEASGAELHCSVYTGLRSPLSGRRRGRVEQLAVAVVPPSRSTRLLLRSRTEREKPLIGYEIYRQAMDSKDAQLAGRTDHRGIFLVEPSASPLHILLVKSGQALLARLPVVPGLESEMTAAVPDDDQRLEAEGFVHGFQEELVDLVTRREVLLARIRARIDAGKLSEAETLMAELRQMKSRDEFRRDLEREQKKIFSADPVIQRRIDTLFSDTRKLLQQYLDPAPVEQLVRELAQGKNKDLSS